MTPIVGYLLKGELPQDRMEARTLRMRVARYTYLSGQLYKRGFSNPLLKCVTADQGLYIMREIHEGRFSPLIHQPAEELNSVISPWPFAKWGIDLIGPLPLGKYRMKFKLCSELGIKKHFYSVAHPQSNGQVEAVNKTIKRNLERKLEGLKSAWVEELPRVLWAY
ncbi:hypothetical protein UlMin_016247 [Ulmus minor]